MKRLAKERLSNQIERLPLDRELREDVRLGVDHLSDVEAAEQARRLEAALDRIPGLVDRLRHRPADDLEDPPSISAALTRKR